MRRFLWYDKRSRIFEEGESSRVKTKRILCDLVCVLGGTLLCLAGGVKVSGVVGVGTVITAFFMGPLIDFFNRKLARPFLYGPQKGPADGRE